MPLNQARTRGNSSCNTELDQLWDQRVRQEELPTEVTEQKEKKKGEAHGLKWSIVARGRGQPAQLCWWQGLNTIGVL